MTCRILYCGLWTWFVAGGCSSNVNQGGPSSETTPISVTSTAPPESITDPLTGRIVPASPGLNVSLNPLGELDLRESAATTATPPTPNTDLDPLNFTPTGTYTPGAGRLARSPLSGQIAVAHHGRNVSHPACDYPIPAPGLTSTTGLTMDGDLGDWPKAAVVSLDREGDIPVADADIRTVYFAKDAQNIYIAMKMKESWNTTQSPLPELVIDFDRLNTNGSTANSGWRTYQVIGSDLFESDIKLTQGTGPGQVDYALAIRDAVIELRLPLSHFGAIGATYAVHFSSESGYSSTQDDAAGTHLVGFTDDYACLIPLPTDSGEYSEVSLAVMRRLSTVAANNAEIAYRAYIAALQAVSYATQENSYTTGTVPLLVGSLNSLSSQKIYIAANSTPLASFISAASGLSYLIGYREYALPSLWGWYGFAEWAQYRAVASYYGLDVAQALRTAVRLDINDAENAENPSKRWITDSSTKAGLFFDYVSGFASITDLRDDIFRRGRRGWTVRDPDEFVDRLTKLRSYSGEADRDFKTGWYYVGAEPTSSITPWLTDNDGDGLAAYEEEREGTDAASLDSDRDGMNDAIEMVLQTPVNVPQGLHSIVIDNYLADWELLLPGTLAKPSNLINPIPSGCDASTSVKRMATIFVEGWLVAAFELEGLPKPEQSLAVTISYDTPSIESKSFSAIWHDNRIVGSAVDYRVPVPFKGRIGEIAINAKDLGIDNGKLPSDAAMFLTIHSYDENGSYQQCHWSVDSKIKTSL